MTTTLSVTDQTALDAALANHGTDPTATIIIDAPDDTALIVCCKVRNAAVIHIVGVSFIDSISGEANVCSVSGSAFVNTVADTARIGAVTGSAYVNSMRQPGRPVTAPKKPAPKAGVKGRPTMPRRPPPARRRTDDGGGGSSSGINIGGIF